MQRPNNTSGFTIVELLIVIVIVAILAAISIMAYTGIQDRAYNTAVESDLNGIAKKLEVYKTLDSTTDQYPLRSQLAGANLSFSKNAYKQLTAPSTQNNLYYCRNAAGDQYALSVITKSDKAYRLVNGNISTVTPSEVWGGTTCTAIGATATGDYSDFGYVNSTGSWQPWVK